MGHQAIVLTCSLLAIALALCPRRKADVGVPGPETPGHPVGESLRSESPAINAPVMADAARTVTGSSIPQRLVESLPYPSLGEQA